MRNQFLPPPQAGPLQKLLTLVVGIVMLTLGLMFSIVAVLVIVLVGLSVWGYLWWKTRDTRRILRQAQASASTVSTTGDIIEGEAMVVNEPRPIIENRSSENRSNLR